MSAFNANWQWPSKVLGLLPDPCDRYACLFDNDRSRRQREVGDVERCRWHGRLIVVKSIRYSGDSNGGTNLVTFKRLRPWRLAYYRARRHLPIEVAS